LHIDSTHQSPYNRFGIKEEIINWAEIISRKHPTILSLAANPYSLSFFNTEDFKSIIIGYNDSPASRDLSGQLIFGGISANGKLPVSTRQYPAGTGIKTPKTRLKYSQPEAFGVQNKDLDTIDNIIRHAITEEAMPGCQVMAIKRGEVIYDKTFGHHTYLKERKVQNNDLFDIASLTKIIATVPALMKLYESDQLDIDQTLGHYLSAINNTNKKDLIIKEILAHQSGLKSWIPFYYKAFTLLKKKDKLTDNEFSYSYPFKVGKHTFLNRNYIFKEDFFRHQPTGKFNIEIAKNMYMNMDYIDTVYQTINQSELSEKKEYKYSDLGYYYFTKIIESQTKVSFREYLDTRFYKPLGMNHTVFLPRQKYPDSIIIPTENDRVFRNQVLRGYVHDPGAAMLGGIAGHAGLFSNARDLAIFMQMLINKGVYGGIRYFNPETIDFFTKCHFCEENRRGLGFDKPEPDKDEFGPTCQCTSLQSYGHSGFTGSYAWADPESQIVYIFLSNRIHPEGYNRKLIEMDIRTNIQKEIHRLFDPGFEKNISEKE
ncbi:MAG: serine hydrolase domain-containing protein, partial [Bacteroidota bacterium]